MCAAKFLGVFRKNGINVEPHFGIGRTVLIAGNAARDEAERRYEGRRLSVGSRRESNSSPKGRNIRKIISSAALNAAIIPTFGRSCW